MGLPQPMQAGQVREWRGIEALVESKVSALQELRDKCHANIRWFYRGIYNRCENTSVTHSNHGPRQNVLSAKSVS